MHLEQNIRRRQLDGAYDVWQKMPVVWYYGEEDTLVLRDEWVLVACFPPTEEGYWSAFRFCNSCFLRNNASAPEWAGDGSGVSLKEPWISALSLCNSETITDITTEV